MNPNLIISVIGLGYVGLPIALAFAKRVKVIGFDINVERVNLMMQHIDPNNEVPAEQFDNCNILFTTNKDDLRQANFHIITVPTPVDANKLPDLQPLLSASEIVGSILKRDDYVVYESTVYPGCTEDDCVPLLEKISGLKMGHDFKVGYSPERINPGDTVHTLINIQKVTSGCDTEAAEKIAQTYELIIEAGIFRAKSIKIAEAAKIIENTQRDTNIALINEFSRIFDLLDINTYDVLDAAKTKWNFLNFGPGLVGGHCIGVDPYYLTYKARQLGYPTFIIESARTLNDSMGQYIALKTMSLLTKNQIIAPPKALILGITYKENVTDIRNSRVVDIIEELKLLHVECDVYDSYANATIVKKEYNVDLISDYTNNKYDAVIIAVNHSEFATFDEQYFSNILNVNGIIIDVKGTLRNKINKFTYWSL